MPEYRVPPQGDGYVSLGLGDGVRLGLGVKALLRSRRDNRGSTDFGIWFPERREKGSRQFLGGSSCQEDGADAIRHRHHHLGSESQDFPDRFWKLADSRHQKGSESQHCFSSSSHQSCLGLGTETDLTGDQMIRGGPPSRTPLPVKGVGAGQAPRYIPAGLVGEHATSPEQLQPLKGCSQSRQGH